MVIKLSRIKKVNEFLGLFPYRSLWLMLSGLLFCIVSAFSSPLQDGTIEGVVSDEKGLPLPGVTILEKGTQNGTQTNMDGEFEIEVGENAVLEISFIGYKTELIDELPVDAPLEVNMEPDLAGLDEIIVVGYGEQREGSVTGAITTVDSEDLTDVPAPTTSQALIGKVAGVTTRLPDGRPGAEANLQIRNMGNPLFVIDGVQSGQNQFNQLGPNDIESISVLKDASAAIYGLRAANGVVLVTTKKGRRNQKNTININSYYGWQSLTRFPEPANAADFVRARAEADLNEVGSTNYTPEELALWAEGTEEGYRGFDWTNYVEDNAPQQYVNVSSSGGSEKTNYYFSLSHLNQDAVFEGYNFNRSNLQANIDSEIADRLTLGLRVNGKVENRDLFGLVGGDNYEQALLGIYRNLPTETPYANNNPDYPNTTQYWASNYAAFEYSGYNTNLRRSLQTSISLDYETPIKGLSANAQYTYFFLNGLEDEFEKTFDTYTYRESDDIYEPTGGQQNPFRTRRNIHVADNILRGQLNYKRDFGDHNVSGLIGIEAQERLNKNFFVRSQPSNNYVDLINEVSEVRETSDNVDESARAGFIFRANYDYKDKYLFEVSGRYDGSWLFPPGERWGLFPSASIGWRITEENFIRNSDISNIVDNFKIRASYGQVGSEPGLAPYAYVPGYNYYAGSAVLDGELITASVDRGLPVTTLSWITATMANVGVDFSLFEGKLSGSADAFYRKRTGLPGQRYDVLIPTEVNLPLPQENLNSDVNKGIEGEINHSNAIGDINYAVGINATLARRRTLESYKPRFGNSWDHYRTSIEDRWAAVNWGREVIGQFQSEEQIANHPVDIDGQNNTTLLPGDFIYKDFNDDGVINGLDERPNGYGENQLPYLTYGLNASIAYKGIDLAVVFAGAALQSRGRGGFLKNPFQQDANSPDFLLNDRWHREDIFDPESPWVPGTYPALRRNPQPSNAAGSDFWFRNIRYLRLRNLQLGYTLPETITKKLRMTQVRLYLNGTNLFSWDNLRDLDVDPETQQPRGLDYPPHRVINVGANIQI